MEKPGSLQSLLASAVSRNGLAGVGVAVVTLGTGPETVCSGLANVRTGRPVDPDTVFRIASVTKTMTAIGLMRLYDDGRFQLDDPVNDYLKTFRIQPPPGGVDVTFRHLLTHTAGIGQLPRLADVVRPTAWGRVRPGSRGASLAKLYRGELRPEVKAGTKWAYANHGFAVLGQLVEDISGVPLPEYMRENVFRPLGMTSTGYLRTPEADARMATGYAMRMGRLRAQFDFDLGSLLGAGAVRSTVSDMTRYAEGLLRTFTGEDEHLLRQETLAEMWSSQFTPDPRVPGMGLAFFLHAFDEHRVVGHDGNEPGFASSLMIAPEDRTAVVVLTNTTTTFGAPILAEAILRDQLDLPDANSCLPRPDVPEQPALWNDLTGYYAPEPGLLTNVRTWMLLAGEAHVLIKHGHLTVRALSPLPELRMGVQLFPVDRQDPTLFAVNAGGMLVLVAFNRPTRDQVGAMCIDHPLLSTLQRRPWWRSSNVRLRASAAIAVGGAWFRSKKHQAPLSSQLVHAQLARKRRPITQS